MWTDYALGKRLRPVTDRTRPCGPKEPGFPVGHVTKPMSPGAVAAPLPAECVCHTLSTMTPPTILISGAGVAGPALAHWLSANGYRVLVVEVAPGIRAGGQTVDLRGAGRGVVERMGLLDQMADRSMRQRGIAWVGSDGSRRAEMPVEAFDGNGVVSKLEILRGDLVDVLYQHTKDRVEYRFDTRIAALEQPTTPSASRSPTARRSWRTS
jgi:2-polyprenyl-6-methoxyphenol hydroxylase-like FAD-dependent oxidoreductase